MPRPYLEVKFGDQRRKRTGEFQNCKQCGIQFYVPKPRLPGRGFCSKSCWQQSARTTSVCVTCGKTFDVLIKQKDRFRNCSLECARKSTHYHNCIRCGKSFRGNSDGSSSHCSEECRRPPVYRDCKTCKKRFRTTPANDNIYCCFSCYRRSTAETRPEAAAREALAMLGVAAFQEYPLGRYSIDFAILDRKIALEIDGSYWHNEKRDAKKNAFVESIGWKLCRVNAEEFYDSQDRCGFLKQALLSTDSGLAFKEQRLLF